MHESESMFDREPHYVTVTATFDVLETQVDRLRDLYEGVTLAFTPAELPRSSFDASAPWSRDVAEQLSLFESQS